MKCRGSPGDFKRCELASPTKGLTNCTMFTMLVMVESANSSGFCVVTISLSDPIEIPMFHGEFLLQKTPENQQKRNRNYGIPPLFPSFPTSKNPPRMRIRPHFQPLVQHVLDLANGREPGNPENPRNPERMTVLVYERFLLVNHSRWM